MADRDIASAPLVDFGSEVCGSLETATQREWLVTNGSGAFACGTVSGILTRRYHGLLIAALQSPRERTLLVSKFDEILAYDGRTYELGANRWTGGSVSPQGFHWLVRFRLEGTTPVWTFACADALIEKRVWMQEGANTSYVRYEMIRGVAKGAEITIKALVNYRDYHATTAGDWTMDVKSVERGLCVVAKPGSTPFFIVSDGGTAEPHAEWYRDFNLTEERARGLTDHEDLFFAGAFRARLAPDRPLTMVLTTDDQVASAAGVVEASRSALPERAEFEEKLLEYWVAARPQASLDAPPWIRQLVLAASQFLVRRSLTDDPTAYAVMAGYPWFGEWSRDAMISLSGLAIETGRPEIARSILQNAARFLDQGMLPNICPDLPLGTAAPSAYNTADATLWYFEALRQYYAATADKELVRELYEPLREVIARHLSGTRYGIQVDSSDGLLRAGEPGVQLTWMDAKVGEQVVTARIGKPIEINALWYNALRTMSRLSFELDKSAKQYIDMADRVQKSFECFWNDGAGCCFDVVDGPDGNDASLRPNQILAVSLPESPLSDERRRAVVDFCERRLVTPAGLRTLDPVDARYRGRYEGSPAERDAAYHQGTVWTWLLGPFVLAHLRVYRDPALAFSFLEPMARRLFAYGLGTLSEISDGDAPFRPRGAFAQAWSVAEVLRAWHACHDAGLPSRQIRAAK